MLSYFFGNCVIAMMTYYQMVLFLVYEISSKSDHFGQKNREKSQVTKMLAISQTFAFLCHSLSSIVFLNMFFFVGGGLLTVTVSPLSWVQPHEIISPKKKLKSIIFTRSRKHLISQRFYTVFKQSKTLKNSNFLTCDIFR